MPINVMQPPRIFKRDSSSLDNPISERLAIYRGLTLLVTDRFHGSILGLQLGNASIIGIENADAYKEPNSKLRDLYYQLGIESRVLRCSDGELPYSQFLDLVSDSELSKISILSNFQKLKLEGFMNIERLVSPLFAH